MHPHKKWPVFYVNQPELQEFMDVVYPSLPGFLDFYDAVFNRINQSSYPDTCLHSESCASMNHTMHCDCGADQIYRTMKRLQQPEGETE
jgi:hypothetical protein